jgi:hypothetical protein
VGIHWLSDERDPVNRYLRRLQQFGKEFSERRSQGEMRNTEHELYDRSRPQDTASTRAKNARHGKVTADKWNQ